MSSLNKKGFIMNDKVIEVGSVFGDSETATIEKVETKTEEAKEESNEETEEKSEEAENKEAEQKEEETADKSEESKDEESEKEGESESDELLPEFQYDDEVFKAEDIVELIEFKKSKAYEILKDKDAFDQLSNEFKIYKETQRSEQRAKVLNDESKEVKQIFDEAVVRFDKEIDLGEDVDPEIAKEIKELYAGYEAREVQVDKATQAAKAYANLTTMEVVVREVPEFKNITSEDILAAWKDPNHENRAEAVLLNDMMMKSTTRSAYSVVDDLNAYFGKTRKSEEKLAENIARKNNKKTSQFGWTIKTEKSTKPKEQKKKENVVVDGVIQVDAISDDKKRANPYLENAPS